MLFCLSTNGLALPAHAAELAELGVTHVTVTVTAVDPKIGSRIYAWVRDGKVIHRGEDAARLLLERQIEGIKILKKHGVIVKSNTIVVPGVNDQHVIEVSKLLSSLDVDIQNIMNAAVEKKLIDTASRVNFAKNSLVLAVPSGNPAKVKDLASLKSAEVKRIAVGNPASVPAGNYTKNALTKLGDWDPLASKFVLAESVRQVLDYLSRGEVDAGFVYGTDAKKAEGKVTVLAEVPTEKPVIYPIASLSASPNKKDAATFIAFVTGPKGQEILAKYGFKKP